MWKCEKCNNYKLTSAKECSCKKFIIDYEGELYERYAVDFKDAALVWAEHYNQDDYPLMNEVVDIEIENEDGEKKMFSVGAEPDIHYSAREKAA